MSGKKRNKSKKKNILLFKPRFIKDILMCLKTQTRRIGVNYKIGDEVVIAAGNESKHIPIINAVVVECYNDKLRNISANDIHKEGFNSYTDFIQIWNEIYKDPFKKWESNPSVWVIGFRILGDYEDIRKAVKGYQDAQAT